MAAFLIVDVEVTDPAAYDEYRKGIGATLEAYGGRFLVRGGAKEALEGDWQPGRVVVLEFPDMARLKAWYASPEYAPLLALRKAASRANMIAVEGV